MGTGEGWTGSWVAVVPEIALVRVAAVPGDLVDPRALLPPLCPMTGVPLPGRQRQCPQPVVDVLPPLPLVLQPVCQPQRCPTRATDPRPPDGTHTSKRDLPDRAVSTMNFSICLVIGCLGLMNANS